jgi:hypothetical protein
METKNEYAEKIKSIRDYIEKCQQKEEEVRKIGFNYDLFFLKNPVSDETEWDEAFAKEIYATNPLGIVNSYVFERFSVLLAEKQDRPTIILRISGDFGRGWEHLSGRLIESFDILTQEVTEIDIDLH